MKVYGQLEKAQLEVTTSSPTKSGGVVFNPTSKRVVVYDTTQAKELAYKGDTDSLDQSKVSGPSLSTDNAIVRYDGTTGKIVKDSLVTIGSSGDIVTPGSLSLDKEVIRKKIATPSSPSAGYVKEYFKADGYKYRLDENGFEIRVGSDSGQPYNYIENGGFESGVSNLTTYQDGFKHSTRVLLPTRGTVPFGGLDKKGFTLVSPGGATYAFWFTEAVNYTGYDYTPPAWASAATCNIYIKVYQTSGGANQRADRAEALSWFAPQLVINGGYGSELNSYPVPGDLISAPLPFVADTSVDFNFVTWGPASNFTLQGSPTGISFNTLVTGALSNSPVDGVGGTSSLVVSSESSSPLLGLRSAKLTKPSSDAQGQGVSILSKNISSFHVGKQHIINMIWKTDSAYIDNAAELWLINPTSGTKTRITKLLKSTSGSMLSFFCTPTDTQARLAIHWVGSETTSAFCWMDDIQLMPRSTDIGTISGSVTSVTRINYTEFNAASTQQTINFKLIDTMTEVVSILVYVNNVFDSTEVVSLSIGTLGNGEIDRLQPLRNIGLGANAYYLTTVNDLVGTGLLQEIITLTLKTTSKNISTLTQGSVDLYLVTRKYA